MKKISMAIVLIVALAILGTAAYAALAYDGNDAEGENEVPQPEEIDQVETIIAPVDTDNRDVTLSVKYPGQGVGGYTYETDREYTFDLTSSSNGWEGKSKIMVFAERSDGGIDTGCIHMSLDGDSIALAKNHVESENILSAAVKNVSLGNEENVQIPIDVSFSRIGEFSLIFQAFDEEGNPISAPLRCSGLQVPASGSVTFEVSEKTTDGEETILKTEVTNNTNMRVTIRAADFYITNDYRAFTANSLSEPESRTLNFRGDASGQDKMEIVLHFDYSGSLDGYRLEYRGAYAAESVALS